MFHSRHPHLRQTLLLAALAIMAGAWLMTTMPALAQGEEARPPSMTARFFGQPDLAAPLVIPMILALGGILSLMAFMGWALKRMPENG